MITTRATIVIDNFNYGRFLERAIESALAQTYAATEVVVVDDGSTDDSLEVARRFDSRVSIRSKRNGGQASAFNEGFEASSGAVVLFLDADDWLAPDCLATVMPLFSDPRVGKVHFPLAEVDEAGRATGRLVPDAELPEGDLRGALVADGPSTQGNPPCSGNAWARRCLARLLPMPEEPYRVGADAYLLELGPLLGTVARVGRPLGCYRVHGRNHYATQTFEHNLAFGLSLYDAVCADMGDLCVDLGLVADRHAFSGRSCFHRVRAALAVLESCIPSGAAFVLADQDEWGTDDVVDGRRRRHFPERHGEYWGLPSDGAAAVRELDRLLGAGARYFALGWPAFWWPEHYPELADRLAAARLLVETEEVIVFDLAACTT